MGPCLHTQLQRTGTTMQSLAALQPNLLLVCTLQSCAGRCRRWRGACQQASWEPHREALHQVSFRAR